MSLALPSPPSRLRGTQFIYQPSKMMDLLGIQGSSLACITWLILHCTGFTAGWRGLELLGNYWDLDILPRAGSDSITANHGCVHHKIVTKQQAASGISFLVGYFYYLHYWFIYLLGVDGNNTKENLRITFKTISQYNFCGYCILP